MNRLEHLEDFKKILKDYHVSAESARTLRQVNLVLMVGPTSAGRNTIIRELMKTGEYHFIVSDTTRQKRVNGNVPEQNGVEYWFRAEEEVLADLRAGKFLEAAVIHDQQVSGISIRELERALAENRIAITDIEIVGTDNIMKAKPDAVAIFVVLPSFEEWMQRLKGRGELSSEELRRRLESALKEFQHALESDYYNFVINDTIDNAAAYVHQLARYGKPDSDLQAQGRKLVEQLYIETQAFLSAQN